jgi:phenylpropionate dioxygenase-like ring-hydroxylating dioxygenase large terminal subunit
MLPVAVDKTEIRFTPFIRKNLSEDEKELVELNIKLNGTVNDQDKFLVERIQRGAKSHGYVPGFLSHIESTLALNHKRFKEIFPVASLNSTPQWGMLASVNEQMKKAL